MRRTAASAHWAVPAVFLFLVALMASRDWMAADHHIDIAVNTENSQFTYTLMDAEGNALGSADTVRAAPGDHIYWNSAQGDWSVQFAEGAPFDNRNKANTRGNRDFLTVMPVQAVGVYKYDVTVTIGETSYTDDPVIIVGPD